MTKEVAIRNLEMIKIAFVNPATKEQRKLINDTVDMAISALSENKEDLISRQAVLNGIAEWIADGYADSVADCSHISSLVSHLPSVENKGEWRPIYQGDEIIDYRCNKCDFGSTFGRGKYRFNFCPNCGADMRGE